MLLSACAPLPIYEKRPAKSSVGCMQATLKRLEHRQASDAELHCSAAGLIARYCSVTEAYLASAAKEFRDLFTAGNAELRDLQSDRRGVRCAHQSRNDAELFICCTAPND